MSGALMGASSVAPYLGTSRTYTSGSGTETVPVGATSCVITAWGGGQGGGFATVGASMEGGGSGGYVKLTIAVLGSQTMTYAVGTGGAGESSQSNGYGVAGGSTTVSGTVFGGTVNIAAGGGTGSGSGGSASGGDTNTSGNAGAGGAAGYGAGAPNGGANAANNASSANAGTAPGGGGGGCVAVTGGIGGAGQIVFDYS